MRITLLQLLATIPALALLAAASPALAAGPGELKFDQSSTEVLESAGVAVVVVERSRGEDGAVSVDYATSDGTAADGSDYTGVSGTLSWEHDDGSNRVVQVPIIDDPDAEGSETIDFMLSNRPGALRSTAACAPGGTTLCLAGGRFQVEAGWRTAQGGVGDGGVIPVEGGRSGLIWFFDPTNIEMLVKVIDACRNFDRYWVCFSATTNVDFTVTVTDTATGIVKQYANPLGRAAEPVQDTLTFSDCP